MSEKRIGVVSHYFSKISVAAIELTEGDLKVGDTIHIKGHTTDLTQPVKSIQVEHHNIQAAHSGDSIGLGVLEHVREHDEVFKVEH
jgi:translation elongation factor EF-1alpha